MKAQSPNIKVSRDNRILVVWLALVCGLIYLMVIVGGVTRLTQSGLSMVDWQPIAGALPPLSQAAWQEEFAAYQRYPEYQKLNQGMSLDEFKTIFYWEYGHRLLGRVIGLAFFLPFVALLLAGKIQRQWRPRLWLALALGGLQGLMGWYMVKSGLVDEPRVSHYRLAAHLLLALFILLYLAWLILDIRQTQKWPAPAWLRTTTWLFAALLCLQTLMGAFTAGLDAGHGFNTYPLMHGEFLASAATTMQPWIVNLVENGVMVQFIHRWLGAAVLLLALGLALACWRRGALAWPAGLLAGLTLVQFLLGVLTLALRVPVALGSLHQAVATLLLLVTVWLLYVQSEAPR